MARRLLEPPALAGLVATSVATFVLIWRWDPISAGHPTYPIFYGVAIALGLSAVIEEADGNVSYWALAHPPGKPDFHHSDCLALELPAA